MLMQNQTGHRLRIPDLKVDLLPGACVELPDGYCLPRRSAGGARIPSVVENLAPGMRPADPIVGAEWAKAPPQEGAIMGGYNPAKPKEAFLREGLPEGLAEIAAARDKLRADQAKTAAQKAGLCTETRAADPEPSTAHTPDSVSESPIAAKTSRKGKKEQ